MEFIILSIVYFVLISKFQVRSFPLDGNICSFVKQNITSCLKIEYDKKLQMFFYPDSDTVSKLADLDEKGFRYMTYPRQININALSSFPMKRVYLYYEKSVHGLGVRARFNFKAGDEIVAYLGETIDFDEAHRRMKQRLAEYMLISDKDKVVDAMKMGNEARFVNHWCSGFNTEMVGLKKDIVKYDVLLASRDISIGDIISFSYTNENIPLEERYNGIQNCTCPSKKHILGKYAVMSLK